MLLFILALFATDEVEKRESERRSVDEKKHQEEIQFLKRTNQQLKVSQDALLEGRR